MNIYDFYCCHTHPTDTKKYGGCVKTPNINN